jgi:hypothetical protein
VVVDPAHGRPFVPASARQDFKDLSAEVQTKQVTNTRDGRANGCFNRGTIAFRRPAVVDACSQSLELNHSPLDRLELDAKLAAQTFQFLPPGRRAWLYKEKISAEDFQPMVAGVDEALNPDTTIQILDRTPTDNGGYQEVPTR